MTHKIKVVVDSSSHFFFLIRLFDVPLNSKLRVSFIKEKNSKRLLLNSLKMKYLQ